MPSASKMHACTTIVWQIDTTHARLWPSSSAHMRRPSTSISYMPVSTDATTAKPSALSTDTSWSNAGARNWSTIRDCTYGEASHTCGRRERSCKASRMSAVGGAVRGDVGTSAVAGSSVGAASGTTTPYVDSNVRSSCVARRSMPSSCDSDVRVP